MVYVDSEGLSDGRSIKNTVQNLAPKMLIVTGGSRRAKASVVAHVRKALDHDSRASGGIKEELGVVGGAAGRLAGGGAGIFGGGGSGGGGNNYSGGGSSSVGGADDSRYVVVEKVLEPLPVGLDSGAFDVLLHDSLHSQLKWKQVCGCTSTRAFRWWLAGFRSVAGLEGGVVNESHGL